MPCVSEELGIIHNVMQHPTVFSTQWSKYANIGGSKYLCSIHIARGPPRPWQIKVAGFYRCRTKSNNLHHTGMWLWQQLSNFSTTLSVLLSQLSINKTYPKPCLRPIQPSRVTGWLKAPALLDPMGNLGQPTSCWHPRHMEVWKIIDP